MATQSVKVRSRRRSTKPVTKVDPKSTEEFAELVQAAKRKEGTWKNIARQYWAETADRD